MGGLERLRDLGHERDRAVGRKRSLFKHGAEIAAFDEAHGEKEDAIGLARLVDRKDIRVVDRGGDPRLALEALAEAVVSQTSGAISLSATVRSSVICVAR